jgi:hypothetical protein
MMLGNLEKPAHNSSKEDPKNQSASKKKPRSDKYMVL